MNSLTQGEARGYQLLLPFLPPSKNEYDRWLPHWQSGCKKKWLRHLRTQLEENMVPRGVAQVGLSAQLVFPTANRRDPQNYAQTLWNFVPDALVECGIIPDDCAGRIDFGPRHLGVRFAVDSRNLPKARRQRTVIAVTMVVPSSAVG
jgi:hypothetical protein